jgi:sugar phosphate isomerase/epimerase
MFTLSAFADEIGPDPQQQIDALLSCGVRHIELRSIHGTNVLSLTDQQVDEFHALLNRHGMRLSAIGSPIGKTRVDEPFEPQLAKLDRAIALSLRFGTPNIRIFSFYPPEGESADAWPKHRTEVVQRLLALSDRAATAGVRLLHENEHRIYGDSPEHLADLLAEIPGPSFEAVYDPANFVFCGYDPWDGWLKTRDRVVHFHIKDWKAGEAHGRIAGEGDGRILDVLRDAVQRGFDGFCTLEPHLLGGGPTGGVTGPDLFPKAVESLRGILHRVGGQERV